MYGSSRFSLQAVVRYAEFASQTWRAEKQDGRVLLVVDDEDLSCSATARMLMLGGYLVLTASSGDEALRIVRSQRPGRIDLVITDINMPGMNGLELADRLRQHRPALPILFMSGARSPRMVRGLPNPYLQKPVSAKDLLGEVQRLLGRQLSGKSGAITYTPEYR
jgi:CheY-like chemotaxis protein